MNEHIPIFCATDENYAPFTSIMMKSLLLHTNSFVDFYIMDGGIEKKTKKLIRKDLKIFPNKAIHYVDMSGYNLERFPNLAHFSVNTFARYFVPEIAADLKKVIYMDVDIVVKQDIAELFHQDLKGYPIGATPCDFNEISMMRQVKGIYSDVDVNSVAFSAGMLLMDIPQLIEMDFTDNAIRLTEAFYQKLRFPDQDILNIIFENNYMALDYRFDYIHTTLPRIKKVKPNIKMVDPLMIHYTVKPWKQNVVCQDDFEEILNDSVFYPIVFKKWYTKKVRYYLFGCIPFMTKYIPKDVFFNQSFVEKKYPTLALKDNL